MNSRTQASLIVAIVGLFSATAEVTNQAASTAVLGCNFYQRGLEDASILDCRSLEESNHYTEAGYTVRRKIFVPVGGAAAWHGQPVWTLSPPLAGREAINSLPADAFRIGGTTKDKLQMIDALSLRRLHQPYGLDLTAVHRLNQLSRLELAETNATCLQRDLLAPPAWAGSLESRLTDRLVSLRLTDNLDLVCIQSGALDSLTSLNELIIRGSPRLISLSGVPALPALVWLEITGTAADTTATPLAENVDTNFCNVSASLRHLTISSSIALLWKPTLNLANISSLKVVPRTGEAVDAIVQRLILRLQAAFCAVWPTGHLLLNGLPVVDLVADQLALDYSSEFCADVSEAVQEYDEESQNRCSIRSTNNTAACEYVCQSMRPTSAPLQPTVPATTLEALSTDKVLNPQEETGNRKTINQAEEKAPGLDREGVIGTTLLTAGAFLGGVLIAAYCCHSRRRMAAAARLKLVSAATITACPVSLPPPGAKNGNATATNGSATTKKNAALSEIDQIRLIGYTAGLGDSGSRVVVFKETANSADADSKVKVKITNEMDEADGDETLLTAQL